MPSLIEWIETAGGMSETASQSKVGISLKRERERDISPRWWGRLVNMEPYRDLFSYLLLRFGTTGPDPDTRPCLSVSFLTVPERVAVDP